MTLTSRLTRNVARLSLALAILAIATAASLAQAPASKRLYRLLDVVVFGTHVPADVSAYPSDIRVLLQQHINRAKAYRPRQRPANLKSDMRMAYAAKEGYERLLVAAAGVSGVERLAQQYVDELRLCYEWEGFHDCPENEAKFAEQYLTKNPNSPFREFLPLLAANRWLCTAEGYELEEMPQDAARSRKASAAPLAVALKSQSLLIRTAAQELQTRARCHA
jgi:hypothetical protein